MAYEEAKRQAPAAHSIRLEDRRRLAVSGVQEVESFDESEVVIMTEDGLLVIKGRELQIDKLSTDSGEVNVQGMITELSYEEATPSGSLWTRLFR